MDSAVLHFPPVQLSDSQAALFLNGGSIKGLDASQQVEMVRVYQSNLFLGVAERDHAGTVSPKRVVNYSAEIDTAQ